MGKRQGGFTIVELLFAAVLAFGLFGWVWNIIKVIEAISDPLTLMLALRVLGIIVAPLGAILGYL